MNIKRKGISIGIIAIFIGLAFIPMSGANIIENKETKLPVEISFYDNNGVKITDIIQLSIDEINTIDKFINELQQIQNEEEFEEKIEEFITFIGRSKISYFNLDWLDNLPGKPIFSFGKGPKYLTKYHGRVQVKKLVSLWNYPSGFGTTVIWGNGLAAAPTQILLKRQCGVMAGFVGLYLHIPPLIKGMTSRTCFFGTAMFAYGLSL
jgi:hypothetical protein